MKAPVFAILLTAFAAAQSTTVNVKVGNQVDTSQGVNGRLQVAMSTSFQLAGWSYQFFNQVPGAPGPLTALNPFHTRVQVVSDGIPLKAPDTWDFTELNTMLSPVQATGDHSPEFQIGTAPAFLSDVSGHILPASYGAFADMSANLVRYYNNGGFDVAGTHFQSPMPYPVTWWGIFNEPDGNGLTAQQYVTLYNTVVPAMAKADPNIKFVAVELSYDSNFVPAFLAGVTAQVDVVAAHFYSTCTQRDYDQVLFATVPGFAGRVQTIYSYLNRIPALAAVPVWVTENNVNADYDLGNGISACNSPQKFVLDTRGSGPFFAAWRTLVFTYLGQAGTQALYHWAFGTDQQYGEVDGNAVPQLSYWVDYYLSHWLPSPPGQDLLQVTESGCCATDFAHHWRGGGGLPLDTTTMAARNADGSVVILMSNYAIQATYDNNGPGVPRTFSLDLSGLGSFSSATLVTLDASTPRSGPALTPVTPSAQMTVTLPGYGAAFLRLANTQPAVPATRVQNAASYASGAVAPGELIALFGTALGPANPGYLTLTNPRLVANSLAGVHVLFDGVPAPLTYAAAGQINAVVPYSVAGKSTTQIQVEYLGAVSAPVSLPVVATAPGLFTHGGSGQGQGAIVNLKDGAINSAANPAAAGDYVILYGTGAGATTPAGVDGLVTAPPWPQLNANVTVTIGGLPAHTAYAGPAPTLVAGVLQINAQIPQGVTPGPSVPVLVAIGNASSQSGVTVAVK